MQEDDDEWSATDVISDGRDSFDEQESPKSLFEGEKKLIEDESEKPKECQGNPPESSLIVIEKQPSALDTPSQVKAPRGQNGRGRGGAHVVSSSPRTPTGDLRDIPARTKVGNVMYDNANLQDSVEQGKTNRRKPLGRETSILNANSTVEHNADASSSSCSRWPKFDTQKNTIEAEQYLLVIQQVAEGFCKQAEQYGKRGIGQLCRELFAVLHDFLIHVCDVGDKNAFLNYNELQTGIQTLIGELVNDLTQKPASTRISDVSPKFTRTTEHPSGVGEKVVVSVLEFLKKVPDRFLASTVNPLNTVWRRSGELSKVVNTTSEDPQPQFIYEYLIFHITNDNQPHRVAAVAVADLCRLISKCGEDGPELRFRVTIGTILLYSMLRIIDIAEEQKITKTSIKCQVVDDYTKIIVETYIMRTLCSLCYGTMRDVCSNAIKEIIGEQQIVRSSSASSTIVNAQIGKDIPPAEAIGNEKINEILQRKRIVEQNLANKSNGNTSHLNNNNNKDITTPETENSDSSSKDKKTEGGCIIL